MGFDFLCLKAQHCWLFWQQIQACKELQSMCLLKRSDINLNQSQRLIFLLWWWHILRGWEVRVLLVFLRIMPENTPSVVQCHCYSILSCFLILHFSHSLLINQSCVDHHHHFQRTVNHIQKKEMLGQLFFIDCNFSVACQWTPAFNKNCRV